MSITVRRSERGGFRRWIQAARAQNPIRKGNRRSETLGQRASRAHRRGDRNALQWPFILAIQCAPTVETPPAL